MDENEDISAFAFNTGKMIERFINKTNNNLEKDYKQLQALVLDFRNILNKEDYADVIIRYDEHFNIQVQKDGEI
jgi:hypothetical protein